MLSSLFPRSSIYKSLDDEGHGHAFDAGNTALFNADEPDEDEQVDHRSSMTGGYRGHRHQPSLPDPFEHSPKTGTIPPQLPLIQSAPTSPGPHGRDRADSPAQDGNSVAAETTLNPFGGHAAYSDDPMAALSQRLSRPFGVDREEIAAEEEEGHPETLLLDEAGPPKSIMFGGHRDASNRHRQSAVTSPTSGQASTMQSQLASSSHILENKRREPWWLRENRKRLGDLAEASSSQSIRLQGPSAQDTTQGPNQNARAQNVSTPTDSPATHTMFLPTHASPFSQGQASASPSSNIRVFVQNVYNVGRGIITSGGHQRQGPIHLQTHLSKKDKALWNWVNVDDLDEFLQEVYTFYVRKGIWSIALAGFLDLLTIGFVIAFSVFLLGCVDYSVIRKSHRLAEVVVPRCVSRFHGATLLLFLSVAVFYALRVFKFGQIVKRLFVMRDFFTELLEVPESDIQTVPWPVIVEKISALRSEHPAVAQHEDFTDLNPGEELLPKPPSANKPRLDAHDVANRIMRKENYFIALFNKNVLNTAIPIPALLAKSRSFAFLTHKLGLVTTVIATGERNRVDTPRGVENASAALLTKVLEWNLKFCLLGFLFGPDGQVRRQFVSERNKKDLVAALQRRFILMGFINAIFAPFIVLYLLFYSFFRYFEEYHKNPSSLGMRSYTQLARWKFREFNELPHIFQMRLHRSYPLADAYISQFPNDRMAQLARFVAFISGSFASVLVLFSLIDPDAFLHFEITPERTVLFYIGVFGSLMAVARGMVPDDHRVVDPEALMREVVEETHYMPVHWRSNLHSADVHREFSLLFPLKIVSFFHEILSVFTTPLVLWFTLPRSSTQIIDFFREFTIHVDGLGYVCSFAVFDFTRTGLGDVRYGAPARVTSAGMPKDSDSEQTMRRVTSSQSESAMEGDNADLESQDGRPQILIDERLIADQGKLEKSIIGFKAAHPNWQPQDQSTSLYLSRMTDLASNSIYLPRPSTATAQREINQYRSNHRLPRSVSRSTGRRSRHIQQPSPFTSPILEDEDALPGIGAGGSALGVAEGVTSSVLEGVRHHNPHMSRRAPYGNDGIASQQQHQPRHVQRAGLRSPAAMPITEENPLREDDDVDPYIRPDEGRESKMHGHSSSEIAGGVSG